MTTERIISLVISLGPSILSILTMVGVIMRVIKDFRDLKKSVVDMKCIEELNVKMSVVIQENIDLKRKLNETMTKIDHIERK